MTLSKATFSTDKRQSIIKSFSWLPSPSSPTSSPTKKFGFFNKFRSSVTDLDQILSSDEEEEEEEERTPTTPRDSMQITASKLEETTLKPTTRYSTPPPPPHHASLNQCIQEILAFTFDQVDERIEKEWEQERQKLEIELLTPAPFQFT